MTTKLSNRGRRRLRSGSASLVLFSLILLVISPTLSDPTDPNSLAIQPESQDRTLSQERMEDQRLRMADIQGQAQMRHANTEQGDPGYNREDTNPSIENKRSAPSSNESSAPKGGNLDQSTRPQSDHRLPTSSRDQNALPLPPQPGMANHEIPIQFVQPIPLAPNRQISDKRQDFETNLNKLRELMKILEITTFLEGDIDPDDKVKLTTRIVDHQNGETTYLTPSFENIDGKFRYSQSLMQQDSDGKYVLSGSAKSDVDEEGSIGLHVQQFDLANERSNKAMFRKYAAYLKLYIDYLYKYNLDLDSDHLKSLKRNFVYYGSLANGKSPSLESNFKMTNLKHFGSRARKYETIGGSQGKQDSSVSYGLSNLNGKQDAHSFQNMVSTSAGEAPISGLQLKVHENQDYIRASAVGQAVAKPSDGVSMTTIDTVGQNGGFGFSDHVSFSEQENSTLATVSELNNLSVPSAKVDPQFRKMHDNYYRQRPKENERPDINTRHLSDRMERIGTHAKNDINMDHDEAAPRKPNFVDADPLYPGEFYRIYKNKSFNELLESGIHVYYILIIC